MRATRFLIFTFLVLCYQRTTAQETHNLSLQQAIEYAQKNNVQVKNALLDIQLQEQVNREVTGMAYPQINGNGGATFNPNIAVQRMPNFFAPAIIGVLQQLDVRDGNGQPIKVNPGTDYGFIDAQFGTKWNSNVGVSLNQILFDGQVFVGLQARNTLIAFKEKNAELTLEQIKQSVAKIYYQLVISKTQIALLDTNISFIEKNIHDTKIMYDNGFAEKLDIDKLNVQLANLNSQKKQVLNSVSNGYLGLKVLLGMPTQDQIFLTDKLTDENLRDGILDASGFDYSQRKDYQTAMLGLKLNEYDMKRYQYTKIPTLSLNGNYGKMAMDNSLGKTLGGPWFASSSIMLNIRIPIFNGFATNARIAQAKIKMLQTQNQIEALKLNIDMERNTAMNTFRTAISDMDYQKQNMALAEKVYLNTKKKYEVGTGSQLEIDNARIQLQMAQTNFYTALYNAVLAKVDFLKATGKL